MVKATSYDNLIKMLSLNISLVINMFFFYRALSVERASAIFFLCFTFLSMRHEKHGPVLCKLAAV